MDRFDGVGWLDWWANSLICLATVEIFVSIESTDSGWVADGHLFNDDDVAGFEFLCDMDPVFVLRFSDDSTIPVVVDTRSGGRRFTLVEYTGPEQRHVSFWMDL